MGLMSVCIFDEALKSQKKCWQRKWPELCQTNSTNLFGRHVAWAGINYVKQGGKAGGV